MVALQVQIAWGSIDSTGGGLSYGIGGCRSMEAKVKRVLLEWAKESTSELEMWMEVI